MGSAIDIPRRIEGQACGFGAATIAAPRELIQFILLPRTDPYPFILLNLFLSALATIQAPVIMMSQNRQDKKDRIRSEMDFDVNRHARVELQGVAQKLNNIGERIGDIEELLRDKAK